MESNLNMNRHLLAAALALFLGAAYTEGGGTVKVLPTYTSNPYTGNTVVKGGAYNPYTGSSVKYRQSYNPVTGTNRGGVSAHNGFTGGSTRARAMHNPMTGTTRGRYVHR